MTEERAKRKLTAILSADVKGYSRLMEDDEEATVRTITAYREVMTNLIKGHDGRVVDAKGDNLLAEFASVVDAVRCGIEIQKELKVRNDELPENRKMAFRIGINLGDVIEEEETIYGDGVNIAARLEELAEGGGICISGTAFDHVEGKLELEFEYLGEQSVKNIKKPVRVYRVEMEGRFSDTGINQEVPLPDKPSIAVLPFVNMSGDPEQEYLADGISENIITALSKIPQMFVIARNSAFTFKGKAVEVRQAARRLEVRYVLEGSVQKAGQRVRITAQLIDATSGHHLWAERYDRNLDDLFAMQDEITLNIAVALQVQMTDGEQARVRHRSTVDLDAWGYFVKAYDLFERHTKEDNARARELLDQALKLDPNYANALALKAVTHFQDARFGYSDSPDESFMHSVELCQRALASDPSDPDSLALWGIIQMAQGQYDQGIVTGEKALTLGPNNAEVHAMVGVNHYYTGKYQKAIEFFKKAMRLHPHYPAWYPHFLGSAYRENQQYDLALASFRDVLARAPHKHWGHFGSAIVYVRLGRVEEARKQVQKALALEPKLTLESYAVSERNYKDPETLKGILDDLRRAGLM
ncbi:MAG: tetratricopeptide repeat protein [Desulfatiglandaceae bacterium]